MKKVFLSTNGCIEGRISTKQLERYFIKNNYERTKDFKEADLIIFFACGLIKAKQKDSVEIIKNYKQNIKQNSKLLVWGCLNKINPSILKGVYNGPKIGTLDENIFKNFLNEEKYPYEKIDCSATKSELDYKDSSYVQRQKYDLFSKILMFVSKKLLKILDKKYLDDSDVYYIRTATGCKGRCSYCAEKLAWGNIKSRPKEKIISEFKIGLEKGYKRFALFATDLGCYGLDIGTNLPDLLKEIISSYGGNNDFSLILHQIGPKHFIRFYQDLKEILSSDKVERIDCPVQSGSDRILKMMKRGYSIDEWKRIIREISIKHPNIKIGTHIMVGFPSENENDFKKNLKLLDLKDNILYCNLFKFSPGSNIPASDYPDQIPEKVKNLRFNKLQRKLSMTVICNLLLNHSYYKIKK